MQYNQQENSGKVYLVGAGPGDIELLTLKGRQVLEQADTIIYDALVGMGILAILPAAAEKINVGKRAGNHQMPQEEINHLLLEQALAGKTVVRLKGGDPFLFGRGGEELELLEQHQIPYEVVPGVTSAFAVPAYAGIPITQRDLSSGVHILTGHKKQDAQLDIAFDALLRTGGTYVFLMGIASLHEILTGFLDAGINPDTPAALIQQGTCAAQRQVIASVSSLEEAAKETKIQAPAVLVVGEVAALGRRFGWYEKQPLFGRRILLTRPQSRNEKLAQYLRRLGAEVLEMPAIRTALRDCQTQLREVLEGISAYQYLVFTSPAGVLYFFTLLAQMELDIRCIGSIRIAAIGSATAAALQEHGLKAALVPKQYHGIALGRLLNQTVQEKEQVLLLRSSAGNPRLVEEIKRGKQIQVTDLAIYDTFDSMDGNKQALALESLIMDDQLDAVFFASASAVRGFAKAAKGAVLTQVKAVCIGQMTAKQAQAYGMQVFQAQKETIQSMVQTVIQLADRKIL